MLTRIKLPEGAEDIPKREIKFKYDSRAFESFEKEGFDSPPNYLRSDFWEQQLLAKHDLSKGKIKVKRKEKDNENDPKITILSNL